MPGASNILQSLDLPQVFATCGREASSFLRMLRCGLEVVEAVKSDLFGIPNAAWTTELRKNREYPQDKELAPRFG